jgi:3-methylcrotonyl-CoA carboxylase alpha subunit
VLAAAAVYRLLARDGRGVSDPWGRVDGWRLNLAAAPQSLVFRCGDTEYAVAAAREVAGWRLQCGDRACLASAEQRADGRLAVALDGVRCNVRVLESGTALAIFADGESWQIEEIDPLLPPQGADVTAGRLTAPMPGRVVQLLVAAGDSVRRGQPMMVVEAMKMEHTIAAPRDGIVAAVHYAAGDLVEEGAEMIVLEEAPGKPPRDAR